MLSLAPLQLSDIGEMVAVFQTIGWGGKDREQFERYLREQAEDARAVLLARWDGAFAGYVTVLWRSPYDLFAAQDIPEVRDFNVLPAFRRRRTGSALMDAAERLIAARSPVAGIGVGLHHDYGAAQRLYVLRGSVPDALGITSHGRRTNWGDIVPIDDDLVLWLTKRFA
ncbi:MAG TPA: GNAT family N-acetyltransferase [Rhizomicrobium sp.]